MKITDDVNDRLLPPATTCPDMFEAKKKMAFFIVFTMPIDKKEKEKNETTTETISPEIEVEGWIVFSTRRGFSFISLLFECVSGNGQGPENTTSTV